MKMRMYLMSNFKLYKDLKDQKEYNLFNDQFVMKLHLMLYYLLIIRMVEIIFNFNQFNYYLLF